MAQRITINDVARMAGVSKVTVSYILNGRQSAVKISEETRSRVWAAVKELDYHPNGVARALARKQTDMLALVLQFPAVLSGWSGFINELMHGATDKAVALGFDLMIHTKFQPSVEGEVNSLCDGRVDGALLLRDWEDPLSEMLMRRGFPHVNIFTRSRHPESYVVDCENVIGGRLATEHLINHGHRRVAHLHGTQQVAAAVDRMKGYKEAMNQHGLEIRESDLLLLTHGNDDFTLFSELLKKSERPTAVFAWSDEVAIQAIEVARSMGVNVPEELAVVGYDSTKFADLTTPRLTSVRQPVYDMAAKAVEILAAQIKGEAPEERQYIFFPELNIRESCGASTLRRS